MISLLRSYQKEVDRLTTRAKQGEEAFLEVFQVLSKVPSVEEAKQTFKEAASLASSAGRLEVQNQKLKHEIEGYKADFKEITSQEMTLRKQEETISQYEQDMKRLTSEGAIDAERKVESRFNDEVARQSEIIAQMKAEMRNTNESATAALRERDIAQAHTSTLESRHNRDMRAKQAEVDMLASEVETLNHMIAEQRTQLSSNDRSSSRHAVVDLAQGTPSKLSGGRFSYDEMATEFDVDKDLEIARLTHELQELSSVLQQQRDLQQRSTTDNESTIERMETMLSSLPTQDQWEKLQKRLTVLEGLEAFMEVGELEVAQGVDVILREKMRKLERQNVDSKTSIKRLETLISELEDLNKTSSQQLSEKDAQIARMEDSISKTPSTALIASEQQGSSSENLESMAQVLKAQRDRLKARVEALEAEKDKLTDVARLAQVEAQSLRDDNVKLYQKVRYVQSYGAGVGSPGITSKSHSAQPSLSSMSSDLESGKSGMVEDKYKSMYEDQVNPFAAFSDREKSKRLENLNPAERLIWSSTSFFMATKNTRMVLFAYLVLLHVLVVIITYRSAVTQTACLNQKADDA